MHNTQMRLDESVAEKLTELGKCLISQSEAKIIIEPYQRADGFWFGAGQLLLDEDGTFILVGSYRNFGDSRTGLAAGERGLELAIYKCDSFLGNYEKIHSFSKSDLACRGRRIFSIEGSALLQGEDGCELFVSSEKEREYPNSVREYQKTGTGVWSIDVLRAPRIDALKKYTPHEVFSSIEPSTLHVKDPVVFNMDVGAVMLYCIHPFSWSSTDTGYAMRKTDRTTFRKMSDAVLRRGPAWDVAATRITDRLSLPQVGVLADLPPLSLYFYDGAECLRRHDENVNALRRPRGYSCEEIGGLAWGFDHEFPRIQRLSLNFPLFMSPFGTGCARYISTLSTSEAIFATWQQSQKDCSQPLVGHMLPMDVVVRILS